ncbi:hypothetical protein BPO_1292 [Bergeyella porcorum]|uniref:Uncharacterized protein n=1 Tax=Bergeyella porcorum TaxID=1735111 RepID=A0AAU0F1W9_9FLAO
MLENRNQNLTPIAQLGEFGLIKHLTENFSLQILPLKSQWEMMPPLSTQRVKK